MDFTTVLTSQPQQVQQPAWIDLILNQETEWAKDYEIYGEFVKGEISATFINLLIFARLQSNEMEVNTFAPTHLRWFPHFLISEQVH